MSAITAVVRPILAGLLYTLKADVAAEVGGHEAVKLKILPRLYRPGDRDCGICFEYAVHDAMNRGEDSVRERLVDASKVCKVQGRHMVLRGEWAVLDELLAERRNHPGVLLPPHTSDEERSARGMEHREVRSRLREVVVAGLELTPSAPKGSDWRDPAGSGSRRGSHADPLLLDCLEQAVAAMSFEEGSVGHPNGDEDAVLEREIGGDTSGDFLDVATRIVALGRDEEVEVGIRVGVAAGPGAEEGHGEEGGVDVPGEGVSEGAGDGKISGAGAGRPPRARDVFTPPVSHRAPVPLWDIAPQLYRPWPRRAACGTSSL